MQTIFYKKTLRLPLVTKMSWILLICIISFSCRKNPFQALKDFNQVNLVANNSTYNAARVDPQFVNGWGMSFSPTGIVWISVNEPGLSEVWKTTGEQVIPAVIIPGAGDAATGGHPSGQVFNATGGFKLSNGNPAKFIFVTEDGTIAGWNGGPSAINAIDNSNNGAEYKGVTIASDNGANFLYAANFTAKKIEVYDSNWTWVNKPFNDPGIPAGYGPFNVQNIGGMLFVMYAEVSPDGDEVDGAGKGFVDVFWPNGTLSKRFATRGWLNAPWGVAQAPSTFFDPDDAMSKIPNAILVGNFGDGHINVFDSHGIFIGPLRSKNKPLAIDGLWAISFAPASATSVNPNWLFFAAGPNGESDGLFGYISK